MAAAAAKENVPATVARRLDALNSPMSLVDQEWAFKWSRYLIYLSGVVAFPIGFYMESFSIIAYVVIGCSALCCLIFVPNWCQTPDASIQFVDAGVADRYWEEINDLGKQLESKKETATRKKK